MHRGRGVGSSDDLSCLIPAGTTSTASFIRCNGDDREATSPGFSCMLIIELVKGSASSRTVSVKSGR